MAKKHPKSWARVDGDLWREFKLMCIRLEMKICDAQTIMLKWFLENYKKDK